MKKIFIIIISLIISSSLFAQEENIVTKRNNEFRISFFQFFMSTFRLSYERMFNNSSIVINGGLTLKESEYEEKLGGQGELQLRFYAIPAKESSFEGVYTGPYLSYQYLDISSYENIWEFGMSSYQEKYRDFYTSVGGGIIIGIKIAAAERVTFDFNFGGGVRYTENSSSNPSNNYSDIFQPGYTGVCPKANFSLGLKF